MIAAKSRGWEVMVHANGEIPVGIAIDAGCRSIEHGFFMGEENLKKMADHEVFWIPTAFTMKAYAAHFNADETITDVPKRNLEHQLNQMSTARDLGVRIALGTDAGSLGVNHGRSMIEELRLMMEAGFSVEETIRCATLNGADLLGLDRLGYIKPSAAATFVVVPGPPSELPGSLEDIKALYVSGDPIRLDSFE